MTPLFQEIHNEGLTSKSPFCLREEDKSKVILGNAKKFRGAKLPTTRDKEAHMNLMQLQIGSTPKISNDHHRLRPDRLSLNIAPRSRTI